VARLVAFVLVGIAVLPYSSSAQNQIPTSNPQALAFAAQAITALKGGASVSDVTLTGTATWTAGSDGETGSATFQALGNGESRMDVALPSGSRTEIRDASTGTGKGKWVAQSGASGMLAPHNCLTDAVWFFPSLGSLAGSTNLIFSYIGLESRNGTNVQHIQSYVYQSNLVQGSGATLQQLSTMDFYLDATTLLPSAISFNVHPDNDATSNIPVEIDFSNYQVTSGLMIPMHIQKHMQDQLLIDATVSNVAFNTGLTLSTFNIN
jgi:hypothetical protein